MACYYPIRAFQPASGGPVSFHEVQDAVSLDLPCGRCIGCRLEKARQWSVRCMHEAKLHECNSFVTLTYRPENVPPGGSLVYRDFQLFIKRLRKVHADKGRIRYFVVGEYGESFDRPHYHALLFGVGFTDLIPFQRMPSYTVFVSPSLERIWGLGFCTVGEVNQETAGYAARYALKKVTGDMAEDHYRVVDPATGEVFQKQPEFARMSLKPGLGAEWLRRYACDYYKKGKVVIDGREHNAPRYYDKLAEQLLPDRVEDVKGARQVAAYARREDSTPERLAVKEEVQKARINFKKRMLP